MKSPGWEDEIAKAEGQGSRPKYINAEARATGPWASVRHAVVKAYPKMPDTTPTLLVINDDLAVSLLDWGSLMIEIELYTPKSAGHQSGYLAEEGKAYVNGISRRDPSSLPGRGLRHPAACRARPTPGKKDEWNVLVDLIQSGRLAKL